MLLRDRFLHLCTKCGLLPLAESRSPWRGRLLLREVEQGDPLERLVEHAPEQLQPVRLLALGPALALGGGLLLGFGFGGFFALGFGGWRPLAAAFPSASAASASARNSLRLTTLRAMAEGDFGAKDGEATGRGCHLSGLFAAASWHSWPAIPDHCSPSSGRSASLRAAACRRPRGRTCSAAWHIPRASENRPASSPPSTACSNSRSQERPAPAAARARAKALAELRRALGLLDADEVDDFPLRDVKAEAEFVVGGHALPVVHAGAVSCPVASSRAIRQASRKAARSSISLVMWTFICPQPSVTVGMPWALSQLASRPPLLIGLQRLAADGARRRLRPIDALALARRCRNDS